jgi:hypothetical protein
MDHKDKNYIYNILGEKLLKKRGIIKEKVLIEDMEISYLSEFPIFGILMSAHWCPPCKGLMPCLKKF